MDSWTCAHAQVITWANLLLNCAEHICACMGFDGSGACHLYENELLFYTRCEYVAAGPNWLSPRLPMGRFTGECSEQSGFDGSVSSARAWGGG